MEDWLIILSIGVSVGVSFYSYADNFVMKRDWKRLIALLDERFKALAAEHGSPYVPVAATKLALGRYDTKGGSMRGELGLGDGRRGVGEVVSPNGFDIEVGVAHTIPRRGQFQDLGFSLNPEGMTISLKGQVYPLSLDQAKLVFNALELEPWPSTLKSFTYGSNQIELVLAASLQGLKGPEVIARFDELWAQSRGYFERFLQTDIDHSKAPQLEAALGLGPKAF